MKEQLLSSLLGTYFSVLMSGTANKYSNLYLVAQSILNLFDDEIIKSELKKEYENNNIAEFEYMLMSSGNNPNYITNMNKKFIYNDKEYSIIDILIILQKFLFKLNDLIIEVLKELDEDVSFDLTLYETK